MHVPAGSDHQRIGTIRNAPVGDGHQDFIAGVFLREGNFAFSPHVKAGLEHCSRWFNRLIINIFEKSILKTR